MNKTIVAVVVVLLLAGGAWFLMQGKSSTPVALPTSSNEPVNDDQAMQKDKTPESSAEPAMGQETKVEIKMLLISLADLGPRMVVITDGGEGSYGFNGEKYYKLGLFPAKLLEMTGAGDAYATGLIAGLFHNKELKEAMRWGAANGASVVEQIGPQAGLLTYYQMLEKLKENSRIVAKEI